MLNYEIKRGDIFYIHKYEITGSEQEPGRPAVIVSNDLCNKFSSTVSVVFLTTKDKKNMATHVPVTSAKKASTALCEQVQTVAIERVGDYMATATDEEMEAIDQGIVVALALGRAANEVAAAKLIEEMNDGQNLVVHEEQPASVPAEEDRESSLRYAAVAAERDVYKRLYEDLLVKVLK